MQIGAASLMLDDGTIEPRVRLIRPMERITLPTRSLDDSHWLEVDRAAFSAAWEAELSEIPETSETTLDLVSGLLLPIWMELPPDETRVYRLQTDAGERLIGRNVSPSWVAGKLARGAAPKIAAADLHALLLAGKTRAVLQGGMELHRARVMGAQRIELSGFPAAEKDRLKAMGLFSEIIAWKLRLFVPADALGIPILATVLDLFPVQSLDAREG